MTDSAGPRQWDRTESIIRALPGSIRMWLQYQRLAPKRATGGVIGGSFVFRAIRKYARDLTPLVTVSAQNTRFDLVIDPADFEVYNHTLRVWLNGSAEEALIRALMRPGYVYFDVGANYGLYALTAAVIGGASSQVFAFEPQPRLASAIRASISANSLSNVSIIAAAIGASEDLRDFYVPQTGSGIGSVMREHASSHSGVLALQVPGITLDGFVEREKISQVDLIKIDIEGAEYDAIMGSMRVLRDYQPYLGFELNSAALLRAGKSVSDIANLLRTVGYSEFFEIASLMSADATAEVISESRICNILAVPDYRMSTFSSAFDAQACKRARVDLNA